jgi:hypothetical protein
MTVKHTTGDMYLKGNLGVGITAEHKLHVVGDAFITGDVGVGIAPESTLHVYENSVEEDAQAGLTIENDGPGDAVTQYVISDASHWVVGVDNSNSDKFKISSSVDLNTDPRLVITTGGLFGFNYRDPVSPLHSFENNTFGDATNGITIEQYGSGDAMMHFLLSGGQRYAMGIDNSDGDKFKICSGEYVDSNPRLAIDLSGNFGFNNASPASRYHFQDDTALADASVGVTIENSFSGDALIQFLNPAQRFVMGIDNSDGDKLKIAHTTDLNSDVMVTFDPATHNTGFGIEIPVNILHVAEDTTNTDETAGMTVEQIGTGDAIIHLRLRGTQHFAMGIDNSDYNKLKISSGLNLHDKPVIEILDGVTPRTTIYYTVVMPDLPTTEPIRVGELWNSSGTMKISDGP